MPVSSELLIRLIVRVSPPKDADAACFANSPSGLVVWLSILTDAPMGLPIKLTLCIFKVSQPLPLNITVSL